MPLVVVARFSELHEGHIAAGALQASGMQSWFPGYGWGAVDWTMRQASGGFPLYVEEDAFEEARLLLEEIRKPDPEALKWRSHPAVLSGLPVAALSIAMPQLGMSIAAARSGPGWRKVALAVMLCAFGTLLLLIILAAERQLPL